MASRSRIPPELLWQALQRNRTYRAATARMYRCWKHVDQALERDAGPDLHQRWRQVSSTFFVRPHYSIVAPTADIGAQVRLESDLFWEPSPDSSLLKSFMRFFALHSLVNKRLGTERLPVIDPSIEDVGTIYWKAAAVQQSSSDEFENPFFRISAVLDIRYALSEIEAEVRRIVRAARKQRRLSLGGKEFSLTWPLQAPADWRRRWKVYDLRCQQPDLSWADLAKVIHGTKPPRADRKFLDLVRDDHQVASRLVAVVFLRRQK